MSEQLAHALFHRVLPVVAVTLCFGAVAVSSASADQRGSPRSGVVTSTRVAGIDVDATTIPRLESLMNRHRLSSARLGPVFEGPIHPLEPQLHSGLTPD